jgi:hypothetical protein
MDPSCMKEESDKTGFIPFSCYSHLRYNHGYSSVILFVLISRAVVYNDKVIPDRSHFLGAKDPVKLSILRCRPFNRPPYPSVIDADR